MPGAPTSWVVLSSRAHPHRWVSPSPSAACLYSKAKTHSKGELDVFCLLIKKRKNYPALAVLQFPAASCAVHIQLLLPCRGNPCQPTPPASSIQRPTAEHTGRSEPGGGKTAHSASREEKGKEYSERILQHCCMSVEKKYPGSFTDGLDAEVVRVKPTHPRQAVG